MFAYNKFFKENSLGLFLMIIVMFYIIYVFTAYLKNKKNAGYETMDSEMNSVYQYDDSPMERTNMMNDQNEVLTADRGNQIEDPNDLLPKDMNSEWTNNHTGGKGNLENINLLKAGYHHGIDTVGQTLKNANRQIRSEPPNPRVNIGPWHNSTITGDYMRVPLEIGNCGGY